MGKIKFSTFQIVFFIFSVGRGTNSLDQFQFIPAIKKVANSAYYVENGDTNTKISGSTFVQSSSKFHTFDRGESGGKFSKVHSQRTETGFHSKHQGKSGFQSESQFPVVQQVLDADLPFLVVPDDSSDSIIDTQHLFRKETSNRSSDQAKELKNGMKGKPRNKWKVNLKSSHLIKMQGIWSGLANKTNVNQRSRGVIVKHIMHSSGNSADGLGSAISQSSSEIGTKGIIPIGKMNLISQSSSTRNGHVMSIHNINEISTNNLKNPWKNQTVIFMGTGLRKEILEFAPISKSRSFRGVKNNVFIHNINLGSKSSAMENKNLNFDSGSVRRLRVDSGSDHGKTETKGGSIGLSSIKKKGIGHSSPNSTRQENSTLESRFTSRSKREEQLNYGSSSVEAKAALLVHNINLSSTIKNRNLGNEDLSKHPSKQESLIGVPVVKQTTQNNVGQEDNNIGSKKVKVSGSSTSAIQITSDTKKRPTFFVHNMHLGPGRSFMESIATSIDRNNDASMPHSAKDRPIKIVNTEKTKAQPSARVFVHSITLGSDTSSMKGREFMRRRSSSKGKKIDASKEGKALQLNSVSMKNKDGVSVERVKTDLDGGGSIVNEGKKETFFSFGSASGTNSRENNANVFVHSIDLGSKKSSTERKSSASVLKRKELVESSSDEKSDFERFSIENKGMDQRGRDIVHNANHGSKSSITKRKETNRDRQVIFKEGRQLFAADIPGTDQVTSGELLRPNVQHQSIFNWNALSHGNILKSRIQKKQVVRPISEKKPHLRYIFTDQNRIDPGDDSNGPLSIDLTHGGGKRKRAQFVAKYTVICRHLVDVIFVLDGSDSIDIASMEQMKMFVINFMSGFQIHQTAAMFGAVIYSSNVSGVVNLGSNADRPSLYAAIRDLPHEMAGTNTAAGIQRMRQMFAMHSRPEVPKVAIVITDGRSKNYSLSTTQASLAHQEGITIFAVGVGQLIDADELQDIAAYGKVRTAESFRELQKLTYALAKEVCTLITPITTSTISTTTTAIPTTMTTHASTMDHTKEYSLPSNICDKCRLVNGVGYREHPGDCQLFIQCYFLGSVIKSVTRDCGLGQFWDQRVLTCVPAQLVNCITDRCRISKIRGYQNRNNCRAYWTCIGGKSYGRCCQPGHTYDEDSGCVQDNTCRQSCGRNQLSPGICPLEVVPGDDTAFQQNIAGHGWKVQKCAPGTLFNISTCSCNTFSRRHPTLAKTCNPEIHLNFDGNDGVRFGIKNENVTVQNGVAKFNGHSRLVLWRFANAYLGKKVFLQVRFIEKGNSSHTEAIVSNGDCGHSPSMYIAQERDTNQLHMGAVTVFGTSEVRIAYKTNGWKKVTYMFDGDHLTGSVDGILKEGRTITGNIESRQCAMQIGAGHGMSNFHGEIDELSLYLCKPENI